ncbi:MAG: bifunctional adenosylcobinamide kinase/adenosylcobinamide-phosphate guanylyltransferase [Defluviitaleaceae bacterium]|nr:bifunctional adenosylcobinamide kinase/adenosylcobinamide-phosphate guanylyltransferase [Defluviitaleaceae bacterium]
MVLIIGGAYQGKLDYALGRFGVTKEDIYFCSDTDIKIPAGKKIVYEIDKWILALVKDGADIADNAKSFVAENPNAVIICDDISCGVVPIDSSLRKWREETGRAVGQIAQESSEVVRLFCGIPTQIK